MIELYRKLFSTQRLDRYEERADSVQEAIDLYHFNIKASESFYPVLSLYEVALRNSLARELRKEFGDNWYQQFFNEPGLRRLTGKINTAKAQIAGRNEVESSDKIIAELTMGFWVQLLNLEYEQVLWKPLRRAFPFMKKSQRQRKNVSGPVNRIRDFRNRVFHHEPIVWNLNNLNQIHDTAYKVMDWINPELRNIAAQIDRVQSTIEEYKS